MRGDYTSAPGFDTYGHHTGDAVLVELAARIRQSLRDFDVAGRYGGEEFMVVLSNCGIEVAQTVCERILSCVADKEIATPAGPSTLRSASDLQLPIQGMKSPESFVRAADEALYLAKAKGRNRIEFRGAIEIKIVNGNREKP